jgi:transcriptional regulator with XRE-family HTH domain
MSMGTNHTRIPLAVLLRDYNLASVARALGVAPSTIYRWRDGRAKPTAERLQALARFLRIDANDILFGDDDTALAS